MNTAEVGLSNNEIADWLDDAADYIEKNGWWRRALLGPNRHQACAVGALLFSRNLGSTQQNDYPVCQASQALIRVIDRNGRYSDNIVLGPSNVMDWNDDKDNGPKNKQEVLDTFRKAAKIARTGFDPDA